MGRDEGPAEMFGGNKNPSTKPVSRCQFSKTTRPNKETKNNVGIFLPDQSNSKFSFSFLSYCKSLYLRWDAHYEEMVFLPVALPSFYSCGGVPRKSAGRRREGYRRERVRLDLQACTCGIGCRQSPSPGPENHIQSVTRTRGRGVCYKCHVWASSPAGFCLLPLFS